MKSPAIRSGILSAFLAAGDITGLLFCFAVSFFLRRWTAYPEPLMHSFGTYTRVWPLIFLWPTAFALAGLYPGYWLNSSKRLQKIVVSSTVAALLFMAFTFLTQTGVQFSRHIFIGAWLFSLFVLPLVRNSIRLVLGRIGFHGPEVIMLGAGRTAELILDHLKDLAIPPIKPVAIFDDDPKKIGTTISDIPVLGSLSEAVAWAKENHLGQILVTIPGLPRERVVPLVEDLSQTFFRLLIVPDLFGLSSNETNSREIGDILALDVKRNLLRRRSRWVKRGLDLALSLIFGIFVLPLFLLCCLLVVLESGFPIFYDQERLGFRSQHFRMIKFRTMVSSADQVLEEELMRNIALQIEWKKIRSLNPIPALHEQGDFCGV